MTKKTDRLLRDKIRTARDLLTQAETGIDLGDLVQVLGDLRRAAETVESATRTAVERSREAGASWAEVAEPLGTSRQAAQQRYGV